MRRSTGSRRSILARTGTRGEGPRSSASPCGSRRGGSTRTASKALKLLQSREDLVRGTGALRRAAFHVSLEVLRAVLAREMDVPLGLSLPAGEADVLPAPPV